MKIENNPKSPLLLTALADAARRGVLSPPGWGGGRPRRGRCIRRKKKACGRLGLGE